jgi:rod shape determining protein RodA
MPIKPHVRMPSFDVPLALAALGLVAIGLLMVYSATSVPGAHQGLWGKQLLWALVAVGAAGAVAAIDHRVYDSIAWPLYGVSLVLLVAVLVFGTSTLGAKRWLDLGPIKFQPSELAKIATVLVLARRFDDPKIRLSRWHHWLPAAFIVLVPLVLVLKEPDLGTALSFAAILIAMLYWGGMPLRQIVLGLTPALNAALFFVTGTLLWFGAGFAILLFFLRPRLPALLLLLLLNGAVAWTTPHLWNHLHDYQKRRIETFLNPNNDPYGAGYQIIQSRIAMGSGGVLGKGYLKGTQKALAFLPMRHTDFIYSVVGEELGLIGTLTVVLLYVLLITRGLMLAVASRNGFASLMAVGIVTALFYHIMVNMLMTIGWAPVTGLPLPLLSYGGTALIVNGIEIGLLQNVAVRRHEY